MTHVQHTNWQSAAADVRKVRERVFVYEWRIPMEIEFDDEDVLSEHVIIYEGKQPIATGRLCPDGYLSRVAVVSSKRNTDAAQQIFEHLKRIAEHKHFPSVTIAPEVSHVRDCMQAGFHLSGRVYMEAGVARQKISCPLEKFKPLNWGWLH